MLVALLFVQDARSRKEAEAQHVCKWWPLRLETGQTVGTSSGHKAALPLSG